MNNNRGKKGFTLIELLVVVLIIGILAAVALPQYKKSVEKARVAQVIPLLKSVVNAQRRYFITNGKYAEKFDELDVTIPWTGTQKWNTNNSTDTRSNDDWSLQIFADDAGNGQAKIGRLKGPYKGTGLFVYLHYTGTSGYKDNQIYCMEPKNTVYTPRWSGAQGEYCKKIFPDSVLHTPVRSDIPFFLVPGAW